MGRKINNTVVSSNQISEDLCGGIYQGKYVLVVGGDVILRSEYAKGDSKNYIIENFENYKKEKGEQYGGFQSVESIKAELAFFLKNEWEYNVQEDVFDKLVSLLSTKCFRVVFTTTFDGYVEAVMRQVWGDELRVMNIYDNERDIFYSTRDEYGLIPPTLYYAFGKAESNYDYVFTDDDAIKVIAKWMSADAPQNLLKYIVNKNILAIGCKFDDWYFRFFWYCLRQNQGVGHSLNERIKGNVAISLNKEEPEDKKLAEYLKRINVSDEGNSREFMSKLSDLLNNPDEVYQKYANSLKIGGIFISYASEDFPIVCQIHSILVGAGFKVWFDNAKLTPGNEYDSRIVKAIDECKVFMPILSRQVKADIESEKWRYYKDEEWKIVEDNKRCEILPVAIYGFDIKADRELLPNLFQTRSILNWGKAGENSIVATLTELSR